MKKILVVDDSDIILESTSMLLKFEVHEVLVASNGEEGLEIIRDTHLDLILCDIAMPGINGFDILDVVRSETKTKSVPFIFLTVFTEKNNIRTGMEKGADGFLPKPYTRDDLLSVVEAQFKKSSIINEKISNKVTEVGKNITYALPHEFRTALNQIINSAKYLQNHTEILDTDDIKELSKDIIDSSDRLVKITENYIVFSELIALSQDSNTLRKLLEFTTVEPGALIHDTVSDIAYKYNRIADLKILNIVDEISIRISSENFYKIINELIDNAFKFSNAETNIVVSTQLDGEYFVFTLQDKGRGMSKEQIENIGALVQFERNIYEQQGMGLGLVISKKIVEMHSGDFIINSKVNEGTTITIKLLLKEDS